MTENRTETAKRFLAKELDKLSEQERQVVDRFYSDGIPTVYPAQPDVVVSSRICGAHHHDEPEPPIRKRSPAARNDYEVNLKAELEIMQLGSAAIVFEQSNATRNDNEQRKDQQT